MPERPLKIFVANPRGFCAGVVRAVDALWDYHRQNQSDKPDAKTYSYHQIIHNTHIVRQFEQAGVVFVNDIAEIPEGSNLMLSAHGVTPEVIKQAEQRGLRLKDATCPLVDKTHREARRYLDEGMTVLLIGHPGHDETVGTLGYAPEVKLIEKPEDVDNLQVPDPDKVALIMQTTLSMDDADAARKAVIGRFPNVVMPKVSDICYATQNRQDGVKTMVDKGAEIVVVVGSQNSSNSKRLAEVAMTAGVVRSYLIDDASELNPDWFVGAEAVGLTSGASAPEDKFQEVMAWFQQLGSTSVEEVTVADESRMSFSPPK